ncbi:MULTISPECIES: hypothetical protein [unclassified Streptomyces]|uniref:hypothetical protein n=1 Tax=unclassified Streptomyces TaxID=2593676 RepID=UPI00225B3622|nr:MULTISPECIES: hypothetical protein [unclassified Streptomyces]MCX5327929.1 hypothetical protein [Streptomyces sp. NBC_00140]MCX5357419.1 hypothetical protein [Streptomyces sp. NBC_00124]
MSDPNGPLIGQRAAIVLLLAILTALAAAALTLTAGSAPATAALTGGATFATATLFFNTIIG